MVDWIEIWVLFVQCDGGQFTFCFFFSERFALEEMFANQPLVGSRTTLLTPSTHP